MSREALRSFGFAFVAPPEAFEKACEESGQPLTLRRHDGYGHDYYFISTFMGDHIRHHAETLNG